MPIYEYICNDCGYHFELLLPMKDADNTPECKSCLNKNVSRLMSRFNAKSNNRFMENGSVSCSGCSGGHCSTCH